MVDSLQLPIGVDAARMHAAETLRTRAESARKSPTEDAGDAAKKFQSVFSTLLVREMRRSLSTGFFGEGADGDIYSGWLDEHVGESLAERDALHMRDMIQRSVLQKAEVTA
jgi:Rod binding domain-containing protein